MATFETYPITDAGKRYGPSVYVGARGHKRAAAAGTLASIAVREVKQ
ncbi:hypothetical protein [Burkholderia pseudomallei]|nr:hypothetical protein [Burkholderia pseudomallei]